ncbi:MAG: EamA family transporter [Verrucomicrobia bacterium]|nr:EamA family transporter [Verrucomicrobiota bacterium]
MNTETLPLPATLLRSPGTESVTTAAPWLSANARNVLAWLTLCGIWGSTWLAIKVGLADLPPFSFAGIRFVVAASALFAACGATRLPLLPTHRGDWKFLAWTGFLTFTMNYGLLFWGEQYISSGLAAVLQATIPMFGLLIAHFYLPAEPLTLPKTAGALLGLSGVGVIFSHQLHAAGALAFWGSVAVVLGALSVAHANVVIKARGAHLSPAVMAAWQMAFGLVPLLAVGFLREGNPLALHWTLPAVGCLLYLALVGSALAFYLSYWLVRRMAVTKTMTIALVTPGVAVALGWVVLGETLSWRTLAGGLCVLAGVGLIVRRGRAG